MSPRPRLLRHVAIAGALLATGIGISVLAANGVADRRQSDDRHVFDSASADVVSHVELALEREQDLTLTAAAQFATDPQFSSTAFETWSTAVSSFKRFPEVQSLGAIVMLPDAALADFSAAVPGGVTINPPGRRPFYCLAVAGVVRKGTPDVAAGQDFCADRGMMNRLLAARDTALGSYEPHELTGKTWLGVQTPMYDGGLAPDTTAKRRAAFRGWLGTSIDPAVVLKAARADHPEIQITLRHRAQGSVITFRAGNLPATERLSHETALRNGWSLLTAASAPASGIWSNGSALAVLGAGSAISLLLSALLFLLTTGRSRALRLVGVRTDQLRYQALHDDLTALPNRALFMDRLEQGMHRARRMSTSIAVLFLDLDGFKTVNDTYGHAAGDQLLRGVSARLTGALRGSDTVARLGGDEFVVLAEDASLALGPEAIAERIRAVLAEPFQLDAAGAAKVYARVSIGIAVGTRPAAEELLRDADVALYEAKAAGKDQFIVFEPAMQMAVQDRLVMEMDLREAVAQQQFSLVYQPTFDLASEAITGVEALLRWDHPRRGLIMPDDFIPLAEETGLIVPMGRWVLEQACEQAAAWQRQGRPLSMAVNISGKQLDGQADLVADVSDALSASGLDPSMLTLEITETMLMRDPMHSALQLQRLKAIGVRVAIDDFGTGYCSLAYLQNFPVDALKIDRSFITGIANSPEAGALIHTLVQLGKTLGIETYAEGIEVRSQLAHLQEAQCDSGQGYLFARPLTPTALEAFLMRKGQGSDGIPLPREQEEAVPNVPVGHS